MPDGLTSELKLDDTRVVGNYVATRATELAYNYVINNYNKQVEEKIKKASEDLQIPIDKFMPKDIKGKKRMLGVFDHDADYKEFVTQGAKKYAYRDKKYGEIHITIAGVPKQGAKALKSLEEFKDNFVFPFKYTNKNLLIRRITMVANNVVDEITSISGFSSKNLT